MQSWRRFLDFTFMRWGEASSWTALVAAIVGSNGCSGEQAADASDTDSGSVFPSDTSGAASSDGSATKLDVGPGTTTTEGDSTGACAASTLEPQVETLPVDVIVIIDTSSTMGPASAQVEANINDNFAQILAQGGFDYRVILISGYGADEQVCVAPPLGGAGCNPPTPVPVNTSRFFHYDRALGTSEFLQKIILWYDEPDPHGLAAGGWSDWLRPEALKVFIGITDSSGGPDQELVESGDTFDANLLALDPTQFGTADDRRYTFHTINGVREKDNPTDPWLPDEGLVEEICSGYEGLLGPGVGMQRVSQLSGGLRFPLCQFGQFDVVFDAIATGLTETTPISCTFPIPDPPEGESIDPNTIEIDYFPAGADAPVTFRQVTGPDACEPEAFYIEAGTISLCPEACEVVQGDLEARLETRYGCDTGFVPG